MSEKPTTEDVAAARDYFAHDRECYAANLANGMSDDPASDKEDLRRCETVLAALDTLEREPERLACIAKLETDNQRIGELGRIGVAQEQRIVDLGAMNLALAQSERNCLKRIAALEATFFRIAKFCVWLAECAAGSYSIEAVEMRRALDKFDEMVGDMSEAIR